MASDRSWLAPTILALGVFVGSVTTSLISLRGNEIAREAKVEATAAKIQSSETHTAVNSRMDELLEVTKQLAAAEATKAAKAAQAEEATRDLVNDARAARAARAAKGAP